MSVFLRLSSFIHRHRTHSYQFAKITKFFKSTAKKVPLATQPARIFRKPSPASANTVPPATRAVAFSQTSSNPSANTVPPATRAVARTGVFFVFSGLRPILGSAPCLSRFQITDCRQKDASHRCSRLRTNFQLHRSRPLLFLAEIQNNSMVSAKNNFIKVN